jgi:hypothetical protein
MRKLQPGRNSVWEAVALTSGDNGNEKCAQKHVRQRVGGSSGLIRQPTASFAVPEMKFPDPDIKEQIAVDQIGPCLLTSGRVPGTRRRCPCAPCSNRGNIPDDRHGVQKGRLSADRNPNKSQVFPVMKEPNGSRIHPPDRFSLPCGKACNALGSNNRVLGKMSDQQR